MNKGVKVKQLYPIVLLCFFATLTKAQNITVYTEPPRSPMSGVAISVNDSATKKLLKEAYIRIVSGRDTINLYTDYNGSVNYSNLKDSVEISVHYMGYKSLTTKVPIPASVHFSLVEKTTDITQVVIKGNLIAIVNKGDTISYNAAAFKVMEDDPILSLFEKIPGVRFDHGMLTYMGESVDLIKFDDQKLFGENVRLALETMPASDVVKVDFYKEEYEFNKDNNIKGGKKRTVANVKTKSKPKMVRQTTLELAVGKGGAKNADSRYSDPYNAYGKFVFSRVGETLTTDAGTNKNTSGGTFYLTPTYYTNMGSSSPALKNSGANFNYNRYKTGKYNFSTQNVFFNKKTYTDNSAETVYFPSTIYNSRSYSNITTSSNRNIAYGSNNKLDLTLKDKSTLNSSVQISYLKNTGNMLNLLRITQDNVPVSSADIRNYNKTQGIDLIAQTEYKKRFQKSRIIFTASGKVSIRNNDIDCLRLDTLSTSTNQIYLLNKGNGRDHNYNGTVKLSVPLATGWSVDCNENINSQNSRSKRMAIDLIANLTDTVNTFDYTLNYFSNIVSTGVSYNDYTRKHGFTSFLVSAGWTSLHQQRDEFFPRDYKFPRTFNTFGGSVYAAYNFSQFENLTFAYSSMGQPLSLEDLRGVIDNTNPLRLTVGNPHLNLPVMHHFQLQGRFISKDGSRKYNLSTSAQFTSDYVATKSIYFARETVLSEYDNYKVPKGSTLTTKANTSGSWRVNCSADYSFRSKLLQSTIDFRANYNYYKVPVFLQEKPSTLTNEILTIVANLKTFFSTKFEASLSSSTMLIFSFNGENRNRNYSESISLKIQSRIAKKYTLDVLPWYNYYYSPTAADYNRGELILNVSAGRKFGENSNFHLSLNVTDLLDQQKSIYLSMQEDYILTTRNTIIGRNIILKAEYKF